MPRNKDFTVEVCALTENGSHALRAAFEAAETEKLNAAQRATRRMAGINVWIAKEDPTVIRCSVRGIYAVMLRMKETAHQRGEYISFVHALLMKSGAQPGDYRITMEGDDVTE